VRERSEILGGRGLGGSPLGGRIVGTTLGSEGKGPGALIAGGVGKIVGARFPSTSFSRKIARIIRLFVLCGYGCLGSPSRNNAIQALSLLSCTTLRTTTSFSSSEQHANGCIRRLSV
jgi:hypothetical protein